MSEGETAALRFGWVSLALTNLAVLVFGVVVALLPARNASYYRAIGAASIGMGLFGFAVSAAGYRRREKWAWLTLWYLPPFWMAHLVWRLPPGRDHVHQVVFAALSLLGLIVPVRDFFPRVRHPTRSLP